MSQRIGRRRISTAVLSKKPNTKDNTLSVDVWDMVDERLVELNIINAEPCCADYVEGEAGSALVANLGITSTNNTDITMYAAFYPASASQALSGAGAVNVTAYLTKFTSTGAAQALTIASGTTIGQMKRVWHVVDGGSGVLTGVFVGGTTITFTTVNEFADFIWTGAAWGVLELGNFTAAGASPALA